MPTKFSFSTILDNYYPVSNVSFKGSRLTLASDMMEQFCYLGLGTHHMYSYEVEMLLTNREQNGLKCGK